MSALLVDRALRLLRALVALGDMLRKHGPRGAGRGGGQAVVCR